MLDLITKIVIINTIVSIGFLLYREFCLML